MDRKHNADVRLMPIGYKIGLLPKERYEKMLADEESVKAEIERLEATWISPDEKLNSILENAGSTRVKSGANMAELVKRPELNYEMLADVDKDRPVLSKKIKEQVEIRLKYDGYIKRQLAQVESFKKMENKKLPKDIDYTQINGLRLEARQKLNDIRPISVGQASRITGVSPADIAVLVVYMEQYGRNKKGEL